MSRLVTKSYGKHGMANQLIDGVSDVVDTRRRAGGGLFWLRICCIAIFNYFMTAVGFWLATGCRGELYLLLALVPGLFVWSLIVGNAVIYFLLLGVMNITLRKRLILMLFANGVLSWALGASMGYKIALAALI